MFTYVFHLLACIKIIQGLTSTLNRLGIKKKYQKVDVLTPSHGTQIIEIKQHDHEHIN